MIYEIYKIYNINVARGSTNDKILLKELGIFIYLLRVFLPNKQTKSINCAVAVKPNLSIFELAQFH